MPIIIKTKNENIITNSVLDEDKTKDFLDDPDLFRDQLPQPYRRVDHVLRELFDAAWATIENNENTKTIENAKYRPNKISSVTKFEVKNSSLF